MTEARQSVTLRTEAGAIQDWESVCAHVLNRASSIKPEIMQFGKIFAGLMDTYDKYTQMCGKMKDSLLARDEYEDVNEYRETTIQQACMIVEKCLQHMSNKYHNVFKRLTEMVDESGIKYEEWGQFSDNIVPTIEHIRDEYLKHENELQKTMEIYMESAENNDRGFFIVARHYQKQLYSFQKIVKTSTDQMKDIINKIKKIEMDKRQFEMSLEKEFIDMVIEYQKSFQLLFNESINELEQLNGKNAWEILSTKLNLFKNDGTTIFEDPVPNKAGALIKSWLEKDMEMSANVSIKTFGDNMFLIVTRWGFVQIYQNQKALSPKIEFYIYDYDIIKDDNNDELITKLYVRHHRSFAPQENIPNGFIIRFENNEAKIQFEKLMNEFQQTHAPQT